MDSPLPDSEVPKAAPFKFDMADTCLDCLKKVEPLLADIGQYIHDHPDMVRGTDFEDRFNKVERQYDGYRKDASSILSRVTGFITRKGRTRAQFVSNRLEEMRSGLVNIESVIRSRMTPEDKLRPVSRIVHALGEVLDAEGSSPNKKVLLVTRRDGLAELEVVYDRLSKPIWGGHSDTFIGENSEFGRVAIKRLRAKIIGGRENARFDREQCVWEGLDHPNILGFVGTTDIDDVPALVSLWMDNGNAREYVEKDVNHTLSRFKLVFQLAEALEYLHHHPKKIIHGDLKGENMLLDKDLNVKLCDFGFTKVGNTNTSPGMQGVASTPWKSPELFKKQKRTLKTDIYSFALTIAELLQAKTPFDHYKDTNDICNAVLRNERPKKEPKQSPAPPRESYERLWSVAEVCWDKKPERRLEIREVVSRLPRPLPDGSVPPSAGVLERLRNLSVSFSSSSSSGSRVSSESR